MQLFSTFSHSTQNKQFMHRACPQLILIELFYLYGKVCISTNSFVDLFLFGKRLGSIREERDREQQMKGKVWVRGEVRSSYPSIPQPLTAVMIKWWLNIHHCMLPSVELCEWSWDRAWEILIAKLKGGLGSRSELGLQDVKSSCIAVRVKLVCVCVSSHKICIFVCVNSHYSDSLSVCVYVCMWYVGRNPAFI